MKLVYIIFFSKSYNRNCIVRPNDLISSHVAHTNNSIWRVTLVPLATSFLDGFQSSALFSVELQV